MAAIYNTSFVDREVYLAISRGAVTGVSFAHITGHNAAVGTSLETIWGESSLYVYRDTATVMKISSGDANDTSAGTGLQTVEIVGLDNSHVEISETVSLNGQTEVNTTKEYLRIFHLHGQTAGSGLQNAGIVYAGTGTVTSGKPAVVHAHMAVGLNHSLAAIFTIPAKYSGCLLSHRQYSSVNKSVDAFLFLRPTGKIFFAEDTLSYTVGEVDELYTPPLVLPAKTDIEVRATAGGGGGDIAAALSIVLIPPQADFEINDLIGVNK